MKKYLLGLMVSLLCLLMLAGCNGGYNKQLVDFVNNYDYAYVYLPDGTVVEGEVSSWTDYEDASQLQVTINGVTYLSHSKNIVLIRHWKD